MLPDQIIYSFSSDKVSAITWVSMSLGPAEISTSFEDISFNWEGKDTPIIVPLRGFML